MNEPVFEANSNDPGMKRAVATARKTFRFFWREMTWEYRRIIPALDLAAIKAASRSGGELSAGGKAPALRIFEFNQKTAPTTRHKRIAEFQNSSAPGGRVFVFTVATAAVATVLGP